MGLATSDIRIFFDKKGGDWVIANDYKKRRLMSQGYSRRKARRKSHGHVNHKKTAEKIKENILANKREKSRNLRVLGCYVRVCDNTYRHYDWVCGLFNTKKNKMKQNYYMRY